MSERTELTGDYTIESIRNRVKPRRVVHGIAAALLPFSAPGVIAEEAFASHLKFTSECGLQNAVNMDTGYVNLLTTDEKRRVLRIASEALGADCSFVAGAYIEGLDGDITDLYRTEIEQICGYGGTPILFQTTRMHGMSPRQKAELYAEVCLAAPSVIGFELGSMFAPNGEIWDDETFARMLEIPNLVGAKHSSLDRETEHRRLDVRDRLRPEFRIYTGNDLGIDMIEYGSDYLLGLATFCPNKFAERDRAWAEGNPSYFDLTDSLQYLGNISFRSPVPGYKHSSAVFLHMTGRIPTALAHPGSPERPRWEADLLRDCARRLNLPVASNYQCEAVPGSR